jgi:hypothetical protein
MWQNPSQGKVPADLIFTSAFSFCFQMNVGLSWVLHRPIETTPSFVQLESTASNVLWLLEFVPVSDRSLPTHLCPQPLRSIKEILPILHLGVSRILAGSLSSGTLLLFEVPMNLRRTYSCLGISSTLFLAACFGNGPILSTANVPSATLSVSPQTLSIPASSTQIFTATTTNSGSAPVTWTLITPGAAGSTGSLSATTGNTITYTAPSVPPVYSGSPSNIIQGDVQIGVGVAPSGVLPAFTTLQFVITAPTVSVGLAPATASVALAGTQQFYGYSTGSTTQGITWQVNGVTGGSTSSGTITQNPTYPYGGLYTAPAIMPMTGPTVTITLISQADPTKTTNAVITLH